MHVVYLGAWKWVGGGEVIQGNEDSPSLDLLLGLDHNKQLELNPTSTNNSPQNDLSQKASELRPCTCPSLKAAQGSEGKGAGQVANLNS